MRLCAMLRSETWWKCATALLNGCVLYPDWQRATAEHGPYSSTALLCVHIYSESLIIHFV